MIHQVTYTKDGHRYEYTSQEPVELLGFDRDRPTTPVFEDRRGRLVTIADFTPKHRHVRWAEYSGDRSTIVP